jgi:UTP--glucose-1-phosphate uridylyltransferase
VGFFAFFAPSRLIISMITKAVIPAAGFGTRMLPAAKAVPKEMLPILDRPTIQYVVEEAADAGVSDVLLVTSRGKGAIEDHFDRHGELEARLAAGGKEGLLASLAGLAAKVTIHATRQGEQRGLGHAVMTARAHTGAGAFLCMLGDTIFSGGQPPAAQLAAAYAKVGTTVIGLEEVPAERVSRYGIVGGTSVGDGILKLDRLVEKPSPQSAPSRMAIAARYVLSPRIHDCLAETKPGKGGEIQLTDALQLLLSREPVHGVVLTAKRHDIGNPVDWLKTNLIYASRDPQTWAALEPLLRELMR